MLSYSIFGLAAVAFTLVNASPCPFGQMAEDGKLSKREAEQFFAARSEGEAAVRAMMDENQKRDEIRAREIEKQNKFYERQLNLGGLLLGGGLLNGVLQPFSGTLQGLGVPTPQEFSLKEIPGDDPLHQFQYPTTNDVRGMCPTLNTMANHGYIARNGITTFAEAANACQITLGFGYDTCTFLSGLGLISGGDLPSGKYSIGGADSRVPNTLGPALGISKHGPFEIDDSISRIDTYFGNQANFNLDRWNQLVGITKQFGGQFSIDMFGAERKLTHEQSLNTNPIYDAGPKQLAVALAERVFIPRALANGTTPDDANFENIAPFYLNETFPDSWFRRATPYSLANVGADIVDLYALSPTTIGHNEGVGNFVPLGMDFGSLTPEEATCFLMQSILDLSPGSLSPALVDYYDLLVGFVNGAMVPLFATYGCALGPYANPGVSAGSSTPGVDTTSPILINGVYH